MDIVIVMLYAIIMIVVNYTTQQVNMHLYNHKVNRFVTRTLKGKAVIKINFP